MTPIERFKKAALELQAEKNILFTAEIRATQTYEDMHTNKGALDKAQSEFLVMVEQFNVDCLHPNTDELATDTAVDEKLQELRRILGEIADTIYTIRWD